MLHPLLGVLTVAEAAYVAAMVDGEGSILVMKRPPSRRLSVRVIVVNTDDGLMRWLARFGGSVHTRSNTYSQFTATPKPVHTWTVNGMNAVALLEQLLPYLVIKRDKAVAGIASQPKRVSTA